MNTTTQAQPDRLPHSGNPPKYPVGQTHVLQACLDHDFVIAMFGRSWGKTALTPMVVAVEGSQERFKGQVYEVAYVGPFHDNARTMYRMMKRVFEAGGWLSNHLGMTGGHNDSELILHLRPFGHNSGCIIHFWGAENYDALRGHRKHRIIVDECKDVAREAVYDVLLPMRLGRQGRFLFIGTPKRSGQGAGWFRQIFRRGLDPEWQAKGYMSFTAPSMANPYLTASEIRSLMDACPDVNTVREEIYAEILEDEGAVFTRLSDAFSMPFATVSRNLWLPQSPPKVTRHDSIWVGLDFGRQHDATIATAFLHGTRSQVGLMRLERTPFQIQMEQIDKFVRLFAPAQVWMVADERGLGSQVSEELGTRYGEGFLKTAWTEDTKERDITAARFLFDEARWRFLAVPWQRTEFEEFMCITQDSKGNWLRRAKYQAGPGCHDDAVTAAALIAPHLSRAFFSAPETKPPPSLGSGEWHEREMDQGEEGPAGYAIGR